MSRTGLFVALALAILVGGVFAVYPELDLKIATLAVPSDAPAGTPFPIGNNGVLNVLRRSWHWISAAFIIASVAAVLFKIARPRRALLVPGRAVILLVSTMVLAPGLVANAILKEHWSRPRPVHVTQFGGPLHFVPWWDPRGECRRNCSFISGEVSGSFWTLAPAALAPAPWRTLAYAGALVFGSAMGAMRMLAGGHFFSDVFFAGIFTFLIIWIVYAIVYRWPGTRISDRAVDAALESLAARFARFRPGAKSAPGVDAAKRES